MSALPELKGSRVLLRKPKGQDIDARISFGLPIEYVKMCGGNSERNKFTSEDGADWYNKVLLHPCK
jgi:hypothetical protein